MTVQELKISVLCFATMNSLKTTQVWLCSINLFAPLAPAHGDCIWIKLFKQNDWGKHYYKWYYTVSCSWHHSPHKKRDGTKQSSSPHAPNASSLNQHVKRKSGLYELQLFYGNSETQKLCCVLYQRRPEQKKPNCANLLCQCLVVLLTNFKLIMNSIVKL